MTTWKMKVNSGNDTNTLMIQLRLYLLCFKYILGCQFVSRYFCLLFSSNNTFYILHLSNSFTNVIKIRLHVAIFLLYLVVVLGFRTRAPQDSGRDRSTVLPSIGSCPPSLCNQRFCCSRRCYSRKSETECDLFQWRGGSKFCLTNVESLVTLKSDVIDGESSDVIEVKVRGAAKMEKECFFFLEEILGVIDQVCLLGLG